jgi:hypothetical protein
VGYTVDPARRLRQHNGELRGGARRTHGALWDILFVVGVHHPGFGAHEGLSMEWHLKRPPRGCGDACSGVRRRIAALPEVLSMRKFAAFARCVDVYVHPAFVDDVWLALLPVRGVSPAITSLQDLSPAT